MGMPEVSRRIPVGDIDLAYRITGRGKPIMLVHGLACGQRMWFHQRRKLSDRHTVITYDQRGHGESDAPDDPTRYSAAHLARDLAGLLDALACDKVAVVGFSLGGGPALALAAARPERITHLVLADVGTGADDAWRIQWLARRWVDFAKRTGWDELLPDMLRSELFKFYANRGPRFRRHMAGLIRATPLDVQPYSVAHVSASSSGTKVPMSVAKPAQSSCRVVPRGFMCGNSR